MPAKPYRAALLACWLAACSATRENDSSGRSTPEKAPEKAPERVRQRIPQPTQLGTGARIHDAGPSDAPTAVIRETDLVDLQSVVPEILLDMRYAGTDNFVGKAVYPVARCLLRRPVAMALGRVQTRLREQNLQLLIWDCYRPFAVQELFWSLVPDARYVASPVRRDGAPHKGSKHNRGAAIDLSLASSDGKALLMPTDHDDFSARAHVGAKGVPAKARANASTLRKVMAAEGFEPIPTEWWHFDYHSWRKFGLSEEPLTRRSESGAR